MPEHEIIQRQRELLRAFRQTTAARIKAESDAEAWRKAELSAAETKFQNAQKQAEAERAKAEADATARLKAERVAVETLISQRRQQADRLLAQVQAIYGKAYVLLKQKKREGLLDQVAIPSFTGDTTADLVMEMQNCLAKAENALKDLESIDLTPTSEKIRYAATFYFTFVVVGTAVLGGYIINFLKLSSIPLIGYVIALGLMLVLMTILTYLLFRGAFRSPRPPCLVLAQAASDVKQWHILWVQHVQEEQQPRISAAESAYQQAVAQARSAFENQSSLISQEFKSASTAIALRYQQILAKAREEYESSIPRILADAQSVVNSVNASMPPWDSTLWESWTPRTAVVEGTYPLGHLTVKGQWHDLVLPALIPLVGDRSFLFRNSGSTSQVIARAIQAFSLRLLHTIPQANSVSLS